jgi:hypothetical protein
MDSEAEIKSILTKIEGTEAKTLEYVKAHLLVKRLEKFLSLGVNGKKDLVAFMHKLNKELRRDAELQFSIQLELDTLQQLKANHSGSSSGNNPISRSDARNAGFNRGSNTQNPQ